MAYIRKLPSGKWQATVRHPSGRKITRSDPLRRVVAEWAAETESQHRRGEWLDPAGGRVTLAEWWAQWSSARVVEAATADRNSSHWRVHVGPAFGAWPLAAITSWEVEAWVARQVRGGVGRETVAASLRLLRQLLAAAVRHRLIGANPADLVRAPAPPRHVDRFLDHDEADTLLEQFAGQDRLFVEVLLTCGLRWSEAAGLHGMRVDLMRKRLLVVEVLRRDGSVKSWPKSSASQRLVALTDDLVAGLSAHMAGRPREGLVFTGRDGGALSYTNWRRRVWVPAVAAAGLATPLPTPHDCRHTYGSWLADEGVQPHDIAALMGHSTLRSTERYVHSSDARFERARDALGARPAHGSKKPRRSG